MQGQENTTATGTPVLSAAAQEILSGVLDVLQDAEELGGPEGADYIALMQAVAAEAERRRAAYEQVLASQGTLL